MTKIANPFTVVSFKKKLPDLGRRIKDARQAKGMTQTELANLVGISTKTVSAIEVSRVEPSISQMQAIASVLEEPIGYFTGETSSSVDSHINRVARELDEIRNLVELIQAKSDIGKK